MTLKKWEDLPINVRRSRKNLYSYIRSEVEGSDDDPEPTPEPAPSERDISISVTDGSDPVKGVTVAIGSISGTTGDAGGCTLKSVADGEQTITATKEGFDEYSDTITVSSESTSFTIVLTAVIPDTET